MVARTTRQIEAFNGTKKCEKANEVVSTSVLDVTAL
jgi:hypothetical protein